MEHDGDQLQSRLDRGALTAFAADELELSIRTTTAGQRLDDAILTNGLDKVVQLLATELRTRLERTALDVLRRNLKDLLCFRNHLGDRLGHNRRHRGSSLHHRRNRHRRNRRRDEGIKTSAKATADMTKTTMLLLALHRRASQRLGSGGLFEKRIRRLVGFLGSTHLYFPENLKSLLF